MCEYLLLPFVEYEVRLGTFSTKFDSCIDKRYFEKIKNALDLGNWKRIAELKTTEYIKDSLRLTNESGHESVILKENVKKKDLTLNDSPFDIRLSINQEFKLNSYTKSFNKNETIVRNKQRWSFISDNFKYDLTIVNQNINGISTIRHEIEFELLVNTNTLTWTSEYINDFIECKIYDLVNIVEPLDREKFKIKIL
jgi:hypothetical protein